MTMSEVLTWTCKECKKVIKSLYPKQLSFLRKQHELSHSEKKVA